MLLDAAGQIRRHELHQLNARKMRQRFPETRSAWASVISAVPSTSCPTMRLRLAAATLVLAALPAAAQTAPCIRATTQCQEWVTYGGSPARSVIRHHARSISAKYSCRSDT